jgi:hypothetical protein
MKKVTIEVTENGWETKLEINGETFIEKHERTDTGAKGYEGNFEEEEEITDEMIDALQGFAQYDIMNALRSHF